MQSKRMKEIKKKREKKKREKEIKRKREKN